jgi:phosphonate dehydrogenase
MLYCEINWLNTKTGRDLCPDQYSLNEISEKNDFVISACPLTNETRHLVEVDFLAQMKPNSILINISRGSVIDDEAVGDTLVGGRLAGDAADVLEMEDWACRTGPRLFSEQLLKQVEKTLFTPHIRSAADWVRVEMAIQEASAGGEYFEGKQPDRAVNRV